MLPTGSNWRGICAITCGMASFAVSDVFIKSVALTHPLGEVFAVRGIFTVLLVGIVIILVGDWRHLGAGLDKAVLWRSLFDATSSALYVSALVHLPMTDVSAVVLLTPIIVTLMAVAIFREHVDAARWLAILVGFAGVLFILRPAPASFNAWVLVALGAAVASSIRDVLTRTLNSSIPTTVLAFASMIALTLVGLAVSPLNGWRPLNFDQYLLLFGSAIFLGGAIYFIALAFRDGEISAVAPFRYTALLWSGIGGYVGFGEIPGPWSLTGAALIALSGLYMLHRTAYSRRRAQVPPATGPDVAGRARTPVE